VSAFTRGPWGIERTAQRAWVGQLREDGKVSSIVCSTDCDPTLIEWARERNLANARLIAASPDLFDGCALFVAACQSGFGIKPEWDDERIYDELPSSALAGAYFTARAALAKATPA
jgi:hypothetical protein